MNPLTQIKNTQKISKDEIELGLSDKSSWHSRFKHSAYIFAGGLPLNLTEGDVLAIFAQYGEIVDLSLSRDRKTGKLFIVGTRVDVQIRWRTIWWLRQGWCLALQSSPHPPALQSLWQSLTLPCTCHANDDCLFSSLCSQESQRALPFWLTRISGPL